MQNVQTGKPEPKKGVAVLWIILGIVLAVILVIALYQGITWLVSPQRRHQADVASYMQEKYSEKFKVKFVKKRSTAEYVSEGCDGSACTYMTGWDHNTIEYVYKVMSISNPKLVSYVVYAENKENGTYQIYETTTTEQVPCGSDGKDGDVYGDNLTYYREKEDLKGMLEYCLGSGYGVDYDSSPKYILISTNKNLGMCAQGDWNGFEEFYNNLVKLLEDKSIKIQIKYTDKTLYLNKNSNFEKDRVVLSVKPIEPVEEIQ